MESEMGVMYRFVGRPGQFVMGVPARNLTAGDLIEILERENITETDVLMSGMYVAESMVEVAPFCGKEASPSVPPQGGRLFGEGCCRVEVARWGERCDEHGGVGEG